MEKRIKRFLGWGFAGFCLLCALVFGGMTVFMTDKTNESVMEISELYMSEMSLQLQQKFSSLIRLRLDQVEGLIASTPPGTAVYGEDMVKDLTDNADVRGFSSIGLCREDSEVEWIGGETVEPNENILEELQENDWVVTRGMNSRGEKILLLGEKASYPMKDGGRSAALIVGISMEYLNEAMFLYSDGARAFSHIIDEDGTFIIRNADAYRESYFERIRDEFQVLDGKTPDQYTKELKEAMAEERDYSTPIQVRGEQRHIYCAPLSENSGWYLVTVMPDGIIKNSVGKLDRVRLSVMIGSMLILMAGMIIVFAGYYRLSRRQVEELAQAKKEADRANAAKSEFLASMSHDIRTPMNAILGMTEIALKNTGDPVRVEDCLKKVKLSGKHLLGLINDVLDMSKIESGKMTLNETPVSLRELMDDIVNIMQPQVKAKKQNFDIFISQIITEDVCCDGVRLNQVLLNFLSNAHKFTPEGGRINVYLYQEPSPRGEEFVQTHFRVEDTGIGMSEEFQKNIFETFSREDTDQVRSISGTGLGMAITKRIADLMDGTLSLQSEKGKGSTFHLTLELKKSAVKAEDMKLPQWNVLVVDDNEQLCQSAAASLKELGVHADWTRDGRKAVDMIEEHHKKNGDYHFVLIDWKMPHMDGMETIRQIRKKVKRDIPVFLISAYDWSDIEDEARDAGVEGFISKPLFRSTLYTSLKQYDHRESASGEGQEDQQMNMEGKKVLLAEDIDINWEIADEILSVFGLELERAVNGLECLEKFKNSKPGYYDAILMDIRMPVMDGYEATKAIRALDRPDSGLPIIAMTADAFSDDAQRCLESGMNAHLAKPLDVRECMRILGMYIGG